MVDRFEDPPAIVDVGQPGDAAFVAQEPKATRTLDFPAQQLGHVLLFAGADAAVEQADVDAAVGHALHVADLGIDGDGPEDDVEQGGHVEDLLVDRQHGDLATAAGRGPVQRQFAFGFAAHAWTSIASACSRTISCRASARWPFSCQLADQFRGPSFRTSSTKRSIDSARCWPFGRRGPDQPQTIALDPHLLEEVAEHRVPANRLVVLLDIVAVARMAAGDHHAIGPQGKGLEHERGIHPPAAHHADDPHAGRVLDAGRAGEVGRRVAAPVAEERHDARLISAGDAGIAESDIAHESF